MNELNFKWSDNLERKNPAAGLSETFSAGAQYYFLQVAKTLAKLLRKNNFPLAGQTRQAKSWCLALKEIRVACTVCKESLDGSWFCSWAVDSAFCLPVGEVKFFGKIFCQNSNSSSRMFWRKLDAEHQMHCVSLVFACCLIFVGKNNIVFGPFQQLKVNRKQIWVKLTASRKCIWCVALCIWHLILCKIPCCDCNKIKIMSRKVLIVLAALCCKTRYKHQPTFAILNWWLYY